MPREAHRASLFHLLDEPDPARPALEGWFADGALVIEDGVVLEAGAWDDIGPRLPQSIPVTRHPHALIVPGFVDAHVHFPQLDMIASPGAQLMDWLTHYTYPAEERFADPRLARQIADLFLGQLLRHGTTTALVFTTVHRGSVEALFEAALARNMRLIAGKVLMDRNAPAGICDTAETGYQDSRALIRAWHGRGRLSYAVTPRFAPTSSERQLELAGRLLQENPGVRLHTHLSENHEEIAIVRRLFPDCADYVSVYEKFGLVTDQAVFAHGVHLSDSEWQRLGRAGSAIAFCPTSNLFLGSGLFDCQSARHHHVPVGLGSDIGAGTSLSLLQTMNEAYKVAQLRKNPLTVFQLFHMATLGGARTLKLDRQIGNFAPGKEADFLVLDLKATPLLAHRLTRARTPEELLFALAILGDDRMVAQAYVAGNPAWSRPGTMT
jgi:guanine deaminase